MRQKLTTKAACELAGINRDRFNEYVAAQFYECAPATVAGRARDFAEDDLVTLILFRQLMDRDMSPKRAGLLACVIGEEARCAPEAEAVMLIDTYMGRPRACQIGEAPEITEIVDGSTIWGLTIVNVGQPRRIARHAIAQHFSTAGEADD